VEVEECASDAADRVHVLAEFLDHVLVVFVDSIIDVE
jgi:hypothetical protein